MPPKKSTCRSLLNALQLSATGQNSMSPRPLTDSLRLAVRPISVTCAVLLGSRSADDGKDDEAGEVTTRRSHKFFSSTMTFTLLLAGPRRSRQLKDSCRPPLRVLD